MAVSEKFHFFSRYLPILLKFALDLLYQRIQASTYRLAYCPLPSPQKVVILAGLTSLVVSLNP
jgi:hypothetical protein